MCKAYKSLVTKWHPDKNSSNKMDESDESFSDHNTRNLEEILDENSPTQARTMDDSGILKKRSSLLARTGSRRSHTPQARPTYLSQSSSRNTTSPAGKSLSKTVSRNENANRRHASETEFSDMSRSTSRRSTTPIVFSQTVARRKPPPVEKKLECTLEQLCHGGSKTIKFTKDTITAQGFVIEREETLKINIKPGWRKGTKITFEGKGDEKPGYLPADIIFSIEEKRHPLFKRRGDDLEIAAEIPLVKALTGCTLTVPLLGGDKMTLTIADIIYPGYEKVIEGQGMLISKESGRRGDLRISFLVNFPQNLTEEQRSLACEILKDS